MHYYIGGNEVRGQHVHRPRALPLTELEVVTTIEKVAWLRCKKEKMGEKKRGGGNEGGK